MHSYVQVRGYLVIFLAFTESATGSALFQDTDIQTYRTQKELYPVLITLISVYAVFESCVCNA